MVGYVVWQHGVITANRGHPARNLLLSNDEGYDVADGNIIERSVDVEDACARSFEMDVLAV